MTLPIGGQIAASDINSEFGRPYYYQIGMYEARNGWYGGINDASSRRPYGDYVGGKSNSGYAYSDWWGYCHGCSYSYVYYEGVESSVDTDICIRRWNFEYTYIQDFWYYWSSGGQIYALTARAGDQLYAYFDPYIGWGCCSALKYVYSNQRGYIFYGGIEYVGQIREIFWTAQSGEYIYVVNLGYW